MGKNSSGAKAQLIVSSDVGAKAPTPQSNRFCSLLELFAAALAAALLSCSFVPCAAAPEKTIRDFSGGIYFETDGGIPDGPCLRISGRLVAPEFFTDLKRVDDSNGTQFLRAGLPVKNFPQQMLLQFVIHDMLCPPEFHSEGPKYLTREEMKSLRLSFYWKRGLDLRPAAGIAERGSSIGLLMPFAKSLAEALPQRFVWSYEYAVPSAGVPLTDHLVLVLRQPNGHVVVRVAARM